MQLVELNWRLGTSSDHLACFCPALHMSGDRKSSCGCQTILSPGTSSEQGFHLHAAGARVLWLLPPPGGRRSCSQRGLHMGHRSDEGQHMPAFLILRNSAVKPEQTACHSSFELSN